MTDQPKVPSENITSPTPIEAQLTELRFNEMEIRERFLGILREVHALGLWRESGARTLQAYCEKKFGYTREEARALALAVGAILPVSQIVAENPESQERVELLRTWRKDESRVQGVAAYRVITNRSLLAIANQNPQSEEALLEIPGIGEKKMEFYGSRILKVLGVEKPKMTAAEFHGPPLSNETKRDFSVVFTH